MRELSDQHPPRIIGTSVTRLEDGPLVRGRGLFAADVLFSFEPHLRVGRRAGGVRPYAAAVRGGGACSLGGGAERRGVRGKSLSGGGRSRACDGRARRA